MGADKDSVMQRCGEILLNLKKNKKNKLFVFNCAFCNENCDQLKKFSLHLDEHAQQISRDSLLASSEAFDNDLEDATQINTKYEEDYKSELDIFEPNIKVEELMEIETPSSARELETNSLSDDTKEKGDKEDPLETKDIGDAWMTRSKSMKSVCIELKSELYANSDDADDESIAKDLNGIEIDYEDSVDDSASWKESSDDDDHKDTYKSACKIRHRLSTKTSSTSKTNSNEDGSSDYDGKASGKNYKTRRRKKNSRIKNIKLDDKLFTVTMLKAFEKQPILWDIKERSHDRSVRQNGFQAIALEVADKLKIQVKWEDIRKRIKQIRDEYSRELDKELKGEVYKMPWYSEHMNFLEDNIRVLIKHRYQKRKYRRLNTLEESQIPILIDYYKNCEMLWQISNIAFVVKPKKMEALKVIIEELKSKHNIDLNIHDIQRRLDYINRLYSKDKEQQLKCELDNKEFIPSSKFYFDLGFLSDSQGPFKCKHCNLIIYKFENYHQHVAEHTNAIPFKCALCELRFNKLHKYIVHAKRHLGINNFHCDVCGKGYPFRAELEWHVREHTGEEPFLCEICGASFRARHGYDNHIRRHEKRFRYECHICQYGFNHLHALNAHVKAHLNIRDILCNVCGKGFTAKKHLLRHQQIHSDTKRYKCGVCGKAFAQDAGLRAHRKQHMEVAKKTEFRKGKYNYD